MQSDWSIPSHYLCLVDEDIELLGFPTFWGHELSAPCLGNGMLLCFHSKFVDQVQNDHRVIIMNEVYYIIH